MGDTFDQEFLNKNNNRIAYSYYITLNCICNKNPPDFLRDFLWNYSSSYFFMFNLTPFLYPIAKAMAVKIMHNKKSKAVENNKNA